jgi:hypothetical protein
MVKTKEKGISNKEFSNFIKREKIDILEKGKISLGGKQYGSYIYFLKINRL